MNGLNTRPKTEDGRPKTEDGRPKTEKRKPSMVKDEDTFGPLYCDLCSRKMSIQLIYSSPQVAHMLNIPLRTIKLYMREGRLKFRYKLLNALVLRRVVDYFQLWDFIENYLPTPEDLNSTNLTDTKRAMLRVLQWQKKAAVLSSERAKQGVLTRGREKAARTSEPNEE